MFHGLGESSLCISNTANQIQKANFEVIAFDQIGMRNPNFYTKLIRSW